MKETKNIKKENGKAEKRTFRLYDSDYHKLKRLSKIIDEPMSEVVRLLIRDSEIILFNNNKKEKL